MIWFFVIALYLFIVVIAYLGTRFICVLEAMVDVLKKRQSVGGYSVLSSAGDQSPVGSVSRKVAELPPEVIAPNLAKPPRSRGGFGSAVRTNDNISIQQRDASQEGSQGSETGCGESDQADPATAEADQLQSGSDSGASPRVDSNPSFKSRTSSDSFGASTNTGSRKSRRPG